MCGVTTVLPPASLRESSVSVSAIEGGRSRNNLMSAFSISRMRFSSRSVRIASVPIMSADAARFGAHRRSRERHGASADNMWYAKFVHGETAKIEIRSCRHETHTTRTMESRTTHVKIILGGETKLRSCAKMASSHSCRCIRLVTRQLLDRPHISPAASACSSCGSPPARRLRCWSGSS